MAIRTQLLLICAVAALSSWALSSPNGKYRMTGSADGVEFVACTPRGLGIPRLVLRCGPVEKISEARRKKDISTGCGKSFAEGRYLLAGGDTLTVRLSDRGVAWTRSSAAEIGLVEPVHNWAPSAETGDMAYRKDVLTIDGVSHPLPVLAEYGRDSYGLVREEGEWRTFHFGSQGDLVKTVAPDFDIRPFFHEENHSLATGAYDVAMTVMSPHDTASQALHADLPAEVADYLASLPEEWDETIWLGGYPGEYAAVARRKDNRWWISVVNATDLPMTGLRVDCSRIFKSVRRRARVTLLEDVPQAAGAGWQVSRLTAMPRKFDVGPHSGISAFIEVY